MTGWSTCLFFIWDITDSSFS